VALGFFSHRLSISQTEDPVLFKMRPRTSRSVLGIDIVGPVNI
jgi:hypothetical protein